MRSRFSSVLAVLLPACALLAASAVHADPREDIEAATRKFLAARSYHVEMRHDGAADAAMALDFVAPDRYRLRTAQGIRVIIGDTMYLDADGQTTQVPLPRGALTRWRDPARLEQLRDTLVFESLGAEPLRGRPARKYRLLNTAPRAESLIWIGADGLPLRIQTRGRVDGREATTTLDYSRYDDPAIRIPAP